MGAVFVEESSLDDLVAGGDACSTSYASDLLLAEDLLVGNGEVAKSVVLQSAFGSLHQHGVSNFHPVDMLAHHATFRESGVDVGVVNLDQEINKTTLGDLTNWCIFALNFFFFSIFVWYI